MIIIFLLISIIKQLNRDSSLKSIAEAHNHTLLHTTTKTQ
jgi:hypothetical protein